MDTMGDLLGRVHAQNSWLLLVAGAAAVGVLVVEAIHRDRFTRGRLAVGVFAGVVCLQAALGSSTALIAATTGAELFAGNAQKILWHPILGVTSLVLVMVAFRSRGRESGFLAPAATAALALVIPDFARLMIVIVTGAGFMALAEYAWRRQRVREPPSADMVRIDREEPK